MEHPPETFAAVPGEYEIAAVADGSGFFEFPTQHVSVDIEGNLVGTDDYGVVTFERTATQKLEKAVLDAANQHVDECLASVEESLLEGCPNGLDVWAFGDDPTEVRREVTKRPVFIVESQGEDISVKAQEPDIADVSYNDGEVETNKGKEFELGGSVSVDDSDIKVVWNGYGW